MKQIYILLFLLAVIITTSQCNRKSQTTIDDEIITDYLNRNSLTATKTASGLYYIITKATTNAQAKNNDIASVFYTGKFMDERVFDSNTKSGSPFEFIIGKGQVIQGWDEGIALLHKGETARLFIPSRLAYNTMGSGQIGPNTVIQFEVELVNLR